MSSTKKNIATLFKANVKKHKVWKFSKFNIFITALILVIVIAITLVVLFLVRGAKNDTNTTANTNTKTATQSISGVTIDRDTLTMKVSAPDITLIAIVSPDSVTNKTVTWTSNNTSVATVNSSGVVHVVNAGVTTITATSVQNTTKYGTCKLTVVQPITGISISNTVELNSGATQILTPAITPSNATNRTLKWTSDNTNVATVDSSGIVTTKLGGTAHIIATSTDGTSISSNSCLVKVIKPVSAVKLDQNSLTMKLGGADTTLIAIITPNDATNQSVTWSSNKTNIVTVDSNGKVHAVGLGTAVIKVTSTQDSSKSSSCTVTVVQPVTGLTVTGNTTGKLGTAIKLTAIISPSNAYNKSVTWTSSDTSIATVSSSGVVTPKAKGTVTITATTQDGSYSATQTIAIS